MTQFLGFLGAAYPWVKAAHLTFVIFWMAGLFILPRFYVYHHETAPGSAEDRAWIEREDRVRTIILTPAMVVVWVLGLMLAFHLGAEPPLAERAKVEGQHHPKHPNDDHCRRQDDGANAVFPLDPGAVLGRSRRRLMVIDVEARKDEQTRHPEDDEGQVRSFHPRVGSAEEAKELGHSAPFTKARNLST